MKIYLEMRKDQKETRIGRQAPTRRSSEMPMLFFALCLFTLSGLACEQACPIDTNADGFVSQQEFTDFGPSLSNQPDVGALIGLAGCQSFFDQVSQPGGLYADDPNRNQSPNAAGSRTVNEGADFIVEAPYLSFDAEFQLELSQENAQAETKFIIERAGSLSWNVTAPFLSERYETIVGHFLLEVLHSDGSAATSGYLYDVTVMNLNIEEDANSGWWGFNPCFGDSCQFEMRFNGSGEYEEWRWQKLYPDDPDEFIPVLEDVNISASITESGANVEYSWWFFAPEWRTIQELEANPDYFNPDFTIGQLSQAEKEHLVANVGTTHYWSVTFQSDQRFARAGPVFYQHDRLETTPVIVCEDACDFNGLGSTFREGDRDRNWETLTKSEYVVPD